MKDTLRSELDRAATALRTLRDDVRVQLHLAGLDAKEEWRVLEPRLESALERASREVTEASRSALAEATQKLRKLKESLQDQKK
jgi:ElaB/YqjD/DUF883 family membrane-anchored ribosome-binding protein